MSFDQETIVAVATPPGAGGVGVIRISGSKVAEIATTLLGKLPPRRKATYSTFKGTNGEIIDQGIALYFPAPNSFTGENVLELQGHGGAIVLDRLLKQVTQSGARQARPGEFSERAFLNGKIDLTQAEAIADLINSSSERAAKCAVRTLSGDFSDQINFVKDEIISLRTLIEATMDFAEEELDIDQSGLKSTLTNTIEKIRSILDKTQHGVVLNDGLTVAIVGVPNAGKSSLLNRLLKENRAIVTEIPGTTRDTLSEKITLQGTPFTIIDTAGLRETSDPIEKEGITRANQAMSEADIVLRVEDIRCAEANPDPEEIIIWNKKDLIQDINPTVNLQDNIIQISAKEGTGIDLVEQALLKKAGTTITREAEYTARRRHLIALSSAIEELQTANSFIESTENMEIVAENLRLAQQHLSEITGEFTTEDLLGEIFSSFCVGK